MKQSPSWENNCFQTVKKFPAFYGTRSFVTAFTGARRLSLFWARSIQSTPSHPTFWISILILPSHLRLDMPRDLFPSSFSTTILCTYLLSPMRVTCLAHLILLYLITRIIFSNTLNRRCSLTVSDQISHPWETTRKIVVLYISFLIFLDSKLEYKRFCTEW